MTACLGQRTRANVDFQVKNDFFKRMNYIVLQYGVLPRNKSDLGRAREVCRNKPKEGRF